MSSSETHPQQHGGARLGVGLALGVVGALAAVGALRRGSRNPRIQTKAVVKRASPKRLQDMDRSDPLVSISWGDKEQTVTVGDIFDHGLIEELDVQYDVSPAGELERLIEFSRWISSLKFPLRIYRGLILELSEDYRSDFGETQYWSTKERVALGFARQESMFGSDPTMKGQLLTAELRSPDLIDWVGTLAYFLTYADEYELVLKMEVEPIRVQELRARPDLVPRRQGREVSR